MRALSAGPLVSIILLMLCDAVRGTNIQPTSRMVVGIQSSSCVYERGATEKYHDRL